MKYLQLLFFGLTLAMMGCMTNSQELVWSDEFEKNGMPDTTYWNYELGDGCPNICGWGNNEEQIYTNDNRNVRIENGRLIIEAIKLDSQWTSARLTTRAKQSFAKGRIEFRAKLPTGIGTWPALWMLGESIGAEGWPDCGEIDIMEHVGRNAGVVQSALHTKSGSGNTINKGETQVDTYDSEFHIYGANWADDRIEFYVDEKVYYIYQPEVFDNSTWPFDKPFFIIMNIAMGGGLGGPIDLSLSRAKMEVDYVRVFK